jgi:peptidoglycan/LPS O-acetylase OafA/YrhL
MPKNETTGPPLVRLEELDSLRGLAAMAVLLEHTLLVFQWPYSMAWSDWPVLSIVTDGDGAVALFFVLSGFVLSRTYFGTGDATVSVGGVLAFYVRRVARIWVPWAAVFAVSYLIQVSWFQLQTTAPPVSQWMHTFWLKTLSLEDVIRQALFMLHDPGLQLLPQDWSLGVELKASAAMPFFVLLALYKPWGLPLLGAAFLVLLPKGHYYASFVVGVMLARHFETIVNVSAGLRPMQRWGWIGGAFLLYQCRALATPDPQTDVLTEKWVWTLTSIGAAGLIVLAHTSGFVRRWLTTRPCLFIGRISFSIYLVQMIVLVWMLPLFMTVLNQLGVSGFVATFAWTFVASIGLTLILAWALFYWVEVPCMSGGRRVARSIELRVDAIWPRRAGDNQA